MSLNDIILKMNCFHKNVVVKDFGVVIQSLKEVNLENKKSIQGLWSIRHSNCINKGGKTRKTTPRYSFC